MARQPVRNPIHDFIAARTRGQWVGFGVTVAILLLGYVYWEASDEPPPDDSDIMAVERRFGPDETNGLLMLEATGDIRNDLEEKIGEPSFDDTFFVFEGYDEIDWERGAEILKQLAPLEAKYEAILEAEHFHTPNHGVPNFNHDGLIESIDAFQHLFFLSMWKGQQQKWDEAWELSLRILRLTNRMMESDNIVVLNLVASAGMGIACSSIERNLIGLAPDAALTRKRTDELKSYRVQNEWLRREFCFDYQHIWSSDIKKILKEEFLLDDDQLVTSVSFKPNATRRLMMIQLREALENIGKPISETSFPKAKAIANAPPAVVNRHGHFLAIELAYYEVFLPDFARGVASLEVTRVALALAGYANEHGGALPATLEELAPTYIDAIPADPMTGKPFQYDPKARKVWSVGKNLQDDGGGDYPEDDIVMRIPKPGE